MCVDKVALARMIAEGNERYTPDEVREILREVEECMSSEHER